MPYLSSISVLSKLLDQRFHDACFYVISRVSSLDTLAAFSKARTPRRMFLLLFTPNSHTMELQCTGVKLLCLSTRYGGQLAAHHAFLIFAFPSPVRRRVAETRQG